MFGNLAQNRDFLQFLAQAGAAADPKGVGGVIGQPTSAWIQREAQGEAMNELLRALQGGGQPQGGGQAQGGTQVPLQDMSTEQAQTQGLTPQAQQSSTQGQETSRLAETTPDQQSQSMLGDFDMDMFEGMLDRVLQGMFPAGRGGR